VYTVEDKKKAKKTIAVNRSARHDYFVCETFEAGLQLFGTEVKSLRLGHANLTDAFCRTDGGELYAYGMHISPYEKGNIFNKDPLRPKKLLMHKREIMRLQGLLTRDGYTLIPLSLYFSGARVKVELGLCKGKKNYDKREDAARRDADREMERTFKEMRAKGM